MPSFTRLQLQQISRALWLAARDRASAADCCVSPGVGTTTDEDLAEQKLCLKEEKQFLKLRAKVEGMMERKKEQRK